MIFITFFEMIMFAILTSSFHLFVANTFDSLNKPEIATGVAAIIVYMFAWFANIKPNYLDRSSLNQMIKNNTS